MAAMSDALEVEVRKHLLRTGSWTKPSALYVALCTVATTDADTGSTITEPSGGSYARVQVDPSDSNWTGASSTNGLSDNAAAITFPTASGSWGTLTHVALCSASTAGTMYLHGALTAPKVIDSGDTLVFPIGALDITFA